MCYTFKDGYREGVVFAFLNNQNEILIEHRKDKEKVNLFYPSGSIEIKDYHSSDDYRMNALLREVKEELNIDLQIENIQYLGELKEDEINIIFYIYLIIDWQGTIPNYIIEDGEEEAKTEWIKLEDAQEIFEFESAKNISKIIENVISSRVK